MKPYVIGIDSSTQSAKAVVWDLAGMQVALGKAPLAVAAPRPGWAEQDPAEWWRSTAAATREALANAAAHGIGPGDIAAVGVAWQRETLLVVDAAGVPLRPAILWLDQRATREAEAARQSIGAERFLRLTGKQLDTTPSFSKLAWMRANEPALYGRIAGIRDVGAHLAEALTGRSCTALAGADSLCLMDLEHGAWSPELLAYLGLDESAVPEVVPTGSIIGGVTPEAAAASGLLAGTPVALAGGDGQVFAVGVDAVSRDVASLTVGTSLVLGVHWPSYRVGPAYRTMAGCYPGTFLLEAVLRAGADIVRWFVRDFRPGCSEEGMEAEIVRLGPGSQGLLTVPYWRGRMVPTNEPLARGVTIGWSDYHTEAHFYRSILEGIAFEVRLLLDAYADDPGVRIAEIRLGGGGALSPVWRQIMADVTGAEVVLSAVESTSLGAGMIAATAVGAYRSLAAASKAMYRPTERLTPHPEHAAAYTELYETCYRELYALLRPHLVALGRRALEKG